jgi:hypothetical protein
MNPKHGTAAGAVGRATPLLTVLFLALCPSFADAAEDEFDWQRDVVVLKGGKEERGVVIEDSDPLRVVLLRDGGRREVFARAEVVRVDKLRDRLASFLGVRKPGLSADQEWQLAEDAVRSRLAHMARLQAYRVLLLDPLHEKAHQFLGHHRAGADWDWILDGRFVPAKKYAERCREWNSRVVLESEHFVVESDAGLARATEVLFDLEGLYLWWLAHLGPELFASEDVDQPRDEKVTFFVHKSLASFQPLAREEPHYDPSGELATAKGGINVARTFYLPDRTRPEELFELGAEALIYSTLVLGKTRGGEPSPELRRSAHWVEIGLAYWVARHAGGAPGYPEFATPLTGAFRVDFDTARRTFETIHAPHPLANARYELTNLIGLSYDNFVGNSANIPLAKARCASFVSFLIEADPPVKKGKKVVGSGRAGLWHYFREVYGTPTASSSSAFEDGFQGGKLESLEAPWKAWTKPFTSVLVR